MLVSYLLKKVLKVQLGWRSCLLAGLLASSLIGRKSPRLNEKGVHGDNDFHLITMVRRFLRDCPSWEPSFFAKLVRLWGTSVWVDECTKRKESFEMARVNNAAGVTGIRLTQDVDALRASGFGKPRLLLNYGEISTQTQELAEECINVNYYGVKKKTEALLPLIQLSDSGRIVNISSSNGKLRNVPNEWARGILSSNAENMVEEKVDEVVHEFLKDFKEGTFAAKSWPVHRSAYTIKSSREYLYETAGLEKSNHQRQLHLPWPCQH
ncbi:hypothetical protein Ancab_037809 [Ancistrocladus abbreviatus]